MPKAKKVGSKKKEGKSKKKNATLIITEKPQAAAKIAAALSNATDEKVTDGNNVSYYEFDRKGQKFLVGCAVGHLFGIQQIAARGPFPNYEVEWRPVFERKSKASEFTKKYYDVLKKLSSRADKFIIATDFDVEGEVIGWNVLRFIAKQKDCKRMKFSTLTKEALENSYKNLMPHLEWGSAIAGETRHYLDWFYGINLSRGLMKALSSTGHFRILSIGRVQGPALKIVYDREMEIKKFKPEVYWQVFLIVRDIKGNKIEVMFPNDITKKSDLLKFKHLKGKKGVASTDIKDHDVASPLPFDLTNLQTESYRLFKLTPTQTLQAAQKLYLAGVISYPRTSSQEYPEDIGYDNILKKLKKYTTLVKYAVNKKPVQGKKKDPAHPAIYPTGEMGKVGAGEKKIYDLIVKRFISCFCKPAVVESKKVVVDIDGLKFAKRGLQIKEKNWMNVYPHTTKEEKIPTIEGDVDVTEIRTEEKMTTPPNRYSPASLVRALEKKNLGTKATRASIVDTLSKRGYVTGKSIEVSDLGLRMVETLKEHSPIILDEELTREIEKDLEKIQESKKDLEKQEEKVLNKSKKAINMIAKDITKNLEAIGKSLEDANEKVWEKEKEENMMTKCPVCHKGNLRIMYGKKFKRYFVSCNAYPKCKTTFGLPPNGMMKPARDKDEKQEMCVECKFPLVVSFKKGSRPWKFCFNPECPSRKKWEKKKAEKEKAGGKGKKVVGKKG